MLLYLIIYNIIRRFIWKSEAEPNAACKKRFISLKEQIHILHKNPVIYYIRGISRLRARPKGFPVALWKVSVAYSKYFVKISDLFI